jgi:hypothetical protein
MTMQSLKAQARSSFLAIQYDIGEAPEGVDALLALDPGLEARASTLIREGWPRSVVRGTIAEAMH